MGNVALLYPDHLQETVSVAPSTAGGSWDSDLPFDNVADRDLSLVARSVDTKLSSTRRDVDLGASRSIGGIAIPKHTLSTSSYVRFMAETTSLLLWADAGRDLSLLSGYAFGRTDSTTCATYIDRNGVVRTVAANVLRDAHFRGGYRRILLEPTRTNICLRSEAIDNATWTDGVTPIVVANATTAPDGNVTADSIEDDNAGGTEYRIQTITVPDDSNTYTNSIFAKPGSGVAVALQISFTGGATPLRYGVVLHPTAGTVVAATGSPMTGTGTYTAPSLVTVTAVANGFYRISVSGANNTSGNTTLNFAIAPAFNATGGTSRVNAATGTSYFWGAQAELGAYPTSYIATTAASVTRAADVLQLSANAGTLYENYWDQATAAEATSNGAHAGGAITFTTGRAYKYIRVMTGTVAEATMLASVYDSGWVVGWPQDFDAEEVDGINVPFIHLPATSQTARYCSLQIDDYSNADGYIDLARVFIGKIYTPTINMDVGAQLILQADTERKVTDGGAAVYNAKPIRRAMRFALDHITESEAFSDAYLIQRQAGKHTQMYVIYDDEDSDELMAERSFLGVLEELSPLAQPYFDRHAIAYQIVEEL